MTMTITRAHLADALHRRIGISRNEAADMVDQVIDVISDAVVAGENIKISAFGTFNSRSKRARVGRNPKTGQSYPIAARRVLTFKASNRLKDKVNRQAKKASATDATAPASPSPTGANE